MNYYNYFLIFTNYAISFIIFGKNRREDKQLIFDFLDKFKFKHPGMTNVLMIIGVLAVIRAI